MKFLHPYFFLLLLLLPLLARWYWQQYKQRHAAVTLPSLQGVAGVETFKAKLRRWLPIFRALGFIGLVVALARPQSVLKEEKIKAEGIDIMLSMDLSSSMLAQDFEPNRLAVSKKMAVEFVKGRPHDRIGLVVFAGEAFTQCPLTTDHKIVEGFLEQLECGNLEDGTAIGMGLAGAVNRLKNSKSKSKVIILLTDGVNNVGYFKPLTAGELAKELGIKVYSIGVGTIGEALTPVSRLSDGSFFLDYAQVEIDEELLREIAKMTGGKYFRAKNNQDLREIYKTIDQLEKTEIQVTRIKKYSEEFHRWVFIGLLFLLAEFVLRQTWLRSLP